MANSVMIFGLGDLGGWVLELLARCEGISKIVTCDNREDWGVRKTHVAAMGAILQGKYKTFEFHKCDARNIDATAELIRTVNPTVIYNNMTLASWWVGRGLSADKTKKWDRMMALSYPLHSALAIKLMQAVNESGTTAPVLNNSYPDVTNPILCRNGLCPLVGSGNFDLLVAEIKRKINLAWHVSIPEITIFMVGEHALIMLGPKEGVPYFFKVLVGGKDVTSEFDVVSLMVDKLAPDGPEETTWMSHPKVAASAVGHLMSILNDTNEFTHAPGPSGLPGGYPIRLGAKSAEVVLPEGLSLEEAIKINVESMRYEGIEEIKDDGTVVATDEARAIAKEMLEIDYPKTVTFADIEGVAKELAGAYRRLIDKRKLGLPTY